MENNSLLYHVWSSLSFDVVATGGRVNEAVQLMSAKKDWPGPRYDGWNHRITLVKFVNKDAATGVTTPRSGLLKRTFLVDAGFGLQAPTKPVKLLRGPGRESGLSFMNVPPEQESRVVWTNIANTVDNDQRMWVYQVKLGDGKEWTPAYCFTEAGFLPQDYDMMSFFTSNNRKSWFTANVVCVKMLLGKASAVTHTGDESQDQVSADGNSIDSKEDSIIGDITLFNDMVKKRVGGKSEVVEQLETEGQRISAMRKWFGIELTPAERKGIRNTPAALS